MRESTIATKAMIAILCIGVAVYGVIYLVQGWDDELVTTHAYTYSLDVGSEAHGILVRTETPLIGGGGYVDQILSEGAKAARGDAVALLYSDPSALTTRQSIRTLTAEIEQLEYAQSDRTQNADAAQLDAQVISSIVSLRSLAARGDLTTLEDSALNLRSMVFKRDYTYGDANAAGQLAQLILDKRTQLDQLKQSLNQVSTTVYAPVSGVYSAASDGWEGVVTPGILEELTTDQLDILLHEQHQPDPNAVGKLVTDSTWYYAALLEGTTTGLQTNRLYELNFSGDYYGQVEMTLERVVLDGEGDRTLAVFSCRSHLADTAMLRIQSVDVVTSHLEGIRIPRKALRIETETVTDEDGSTREVNHYKVYTVIRSQSWGQEVEVLYTDPNYYLVRPVDENVSNRLRAGDEVILNTADIFDGKVVR